jgi:hypothetical protein
VLVSNQLHVKVINKNNYGKTGFSFYFPLSIKFLAKFFCEFEALRDLISVLFRVFCYTYLFVQKQSCFAYFPLLGNYEAKRTQKMARKK